VKEADNMNKTSSVITIGREYGSAGRQIGQGIARYFGIKCYDKELLEHAASESGICKEVFENHDEKPTNSFLYSLVMDTYSFGYSSAGAGFAEMPMNHKVFLAQFDAIKKLASEGPCVMVGRCADYALADNKDCFSIFVHADLNWRINRISEKYHKTPKEAKDMITKLDKSRSSYYNYYTNKKWGAAGGYNLCIDSSKFGIDGTIKTIIEAIKIFDESKIK
jgi:cytidylate kinase